MHRLNGISHFVVEFLPILTTIKEQWDTERLNPIF